MAPPAEDGDLAEVADLDRTDKGASGETARQETGSANGASNTENETVNEMSAGDGQVDSAGARVPQPEATESDEGDIVAEPEPVPVTPTGGEDDEDEEEVTPDPEPDSEPERPATPVDLRFWMVAAASNHLG